MYFKGNPLNDIDQILNELPVAERELVVVEFRKSNSGLVGEFNIVLRAQS